MKRILFAFLLLIPATSLAEFYFPVERGANFMSGCFPLRSTASNGAELLSGVTGATTDFTITLFEDDKSDGVSFTGADIEAGTQGTFTVPSTPSDIAFNECDATGLYQVHLHQEYTADSIVTSADVVDGGTGYTAGDDLTVSGGTGTAATLNVDTESSGVITAVSVLTSGAYTVVPANPVSVTGGTGTGATFNLTLGDDPTTGITLKLDDAGATMGDQTVFLDLSFATSDQIQDDFVAAATTYGTATENNVDGVDGKVNTVQNTVDGIANDTASIDGAIGDPVDLGGGATIADNMSDINDVAEAMSRGLTPHNTTLATVTDNRNFTITSGSPDDDAYNPCSIMVTDQVDPTQMAFAEILDYDGDTKDIDLEFNPSTSFTFASGDLATITCTPR